MRADEAAVRAAVARHRAFDGLSRREAIRRVGAVLGGTVIVGQSAWLAGCASVPDGVQAAGRAGAQPLDRLFMATDIVLLDEVADTILPETSTPGAKAAGVGPFIAVMVADTYTAQEQQTFTEGLAALQVEALGEFGVTFVNAGTQQRTRLLERLDNEQHVYMGSRASDEPTHYFRMIKQLTLLGYFTSEIGVTQAQRYRESPGRFEPCVPYSPGDRSWAPHA